MTKHKSFYEKIFADVDRRIWSRTLNFIDCRRDSIIFRIFVYVALVLVVSNGIQYYAGIQKNIWIGLAQITIFLFSAFLLYKGRDLWAKNLVLSFMNCTFFISSSTYGREIPSYLYIIPIVLGTLFFFKSDQLKYAIALLILPFINLFLLEYTDYSLLKNHQAELTASQLKLRTVINLIISIGLGVILMRELIFMHRYNQRRLKRLNLKLKKKNEKLKKINGELDSFVYRSSHDLRSPLTSIMGIINIIKSESDMDKIAEYMSFQEKSVKKLDTLIQDILNISRNARTDVDVATIPVKQLVEECLHSLSDMEEFQRVKVVVNIPDTVICFSDPQRLKVVFQNLFSNALRYYDYSKAQPFLKIELVEPDNDRVQLLVSDNGIGIKQEHLQKAFDMFYRATDRNNGSGLGLYIVKEALGKVEGRITLSSIYGEGTAVLVTIVNLAMPKEAKTAKREKRVHE